MFEIQNNSSTAFSGFAAVASCTANQAVAERMMLEWTTLDGEYGRYPGVGKAVNDEFVKAIDAVNKWFDDGFSGGVWCRSKAELDAYSNLLQRAKGALASEILAKGLKPSEKRSSDVKLSTEGEKITADPGWWGLTLGVLAFSAAAIVARRRRAGLGGVKSFRRKYGRGRHG